MRLGACVSVLLLIASNFTFGACNKPENANDKSSSSDKSDKSKKDDDKKKGDDDDDDDDDKKTDKKKKKKGDDDDDDDDKKTAKKKKKADDDDDDDDDKKTVKKKKGDDDDDAPTDNGSGKKGGGDPPPAAEALFAGKYSSNWGTTVFKQDGTKVTGTYPGGSLACTVIKEVSIACQWFENGGSGRAFMTRNATSGVISGAWGNGSSSNDGGSWTFTPIK